MLSSHISALKNQTLIGITIFLFGIWLAWELAGKIVANDMQTLTLAALAFVACVILVSTMRNWRSGFYFFLVWLMFEDLVRKYMGNGLIFFFGKDVLILLVGISFFFSLRQGHEKPFKPPFLLFLSFFVWLGLLQIFNPYSPHILYGLLGFKLYFFYVPLVYVGYALIRDDEDLRKFLVANLVLAAVIAGLGITQAIRGNSFLNPADLAPDLRGLGDLSKTTPISNQTLSLPDSVFVSSGRFAEYLIIAFILTMGTAAYLLLCTNRNRKLSLVTLALLVAAALFSGSRGCVTYVVASGFALSAGFLWGAPWQWRQSNRLALAIRRSFMIAAFALTVVLVVFPNEAGSRVAFYRETLIPDSPAYELSFRSWDYPLYNLEKAFAEPNWVFGNGIGTASLGGQYISRLLRKRPPDIGVEEGYGTLIIEMGILAPVLWFLWTLALMFYSWKVVRRLRRTRFFPVALGIFWFAFLLLFPQTFGGIAAFQNYIANVYLWLLVGILFRLPLILAESPMAPKLAS